MNDILKEIQITDEKDSNGQIIASGLLGGEAVVGVVIAIITAVQALG